jgi:putative ABC transport system permease protein
MQALWQDLRYGARLLAKKPGFTFVIVLTLALGIGANTAIFSAAEAIFFRALPYNEAEQLLYLTSSFPGNTRGGDNFSYLDFADLQAQQKVFDAVAAYHDFTPLALSGTGEPVQLTANFVSASYFEMFRARTGLGRLFSPEENRAPDAPPLLVLSHGCWQRVFGGDPQVIGRKIELSQIPMTVIGVMAADFSDLQETWRAEIDAWLPMGLTRQIVSPALFEDRNARLFYGVARIKKDVSFEQARTDLDAVAKRLEEAYPASNKGFGLHLAPLRDHFVGNF